MSSIRFVTSEFMAANGIDKETAYPILTYLRKRGLLIEDGAASSPTKKGKGETYYKGDSEEIAKALAELKFPSPTA